MDNRRDNFRVRLLGRERIPAELLLPDGKSVTAKIITLSVGGVGVLTVSLLHGLELNQTLDIRFQLPKAPMPLNYAVEVRRIGHTTEGDILGLQFQSTGVEAIDDERTKEIWPFLLARQNRDIYTVRKPSKRSS